MSVVWDVDTLGCFALLWRVFVNWMLLQEGDPRDLFGRITFEDSMYILRCGLLALVSVGFIVYECTRLRPGIHYPVRNVVRRP